MSGSDGESQSEITEAKKTMQSDNDRRDSAIKAAECLCKGTGASSTSNPFICNPVIVYIVSAYMRANKQAIKQVVLGHFAPQTIHAAKNELWLKYPSKLIGEQKVRKGSLLKPKHEFETEDIIDAISVIDAEGTPFCAHVSAYDMHLIPPCRPEELIHVSVVERLNRIEAQMMVMHEQMSGLREENHMLRQRIDREAEHNCDLRAKVDFMVMPPPFPPPLPPPSRQTQRPATYAEKASMQQTKSQQQQQQTGSWSADQETNNTRSRAGSQSSAASDYRVPPKEKRRQRRRQPRHMGTRTTPSDCSLKGAPLPMRDLFVYRVMKPSTCDDIRTYIQELNINATLGDIEMVAHAKFNSFHVSCDVVSYKRLMNPGMWTEGICVDKYWQKASKTDTHSNGGS